MAMAEDNGEFDGLETLFAAARAQAPEPSAALFARIEADALRVAAEPRAPSLRPAPGRAVRAGFWHRLNLTLGGRGAVAGLASATLAGLWLGFAPPSGLDRLTQSVAQGVLGASASLDGLDLIPTLDTVLTQG